jgi:Fe-S-cluster containining protein
MDQGYCKNCGECCRELHFLVAPAGRGLDSAVHEFYERRGVKVGLMNGCLWAIVPNICRYLTKKNKCAIYDERPVSCQKYDGRQHSLTNCRAREER